MVGNMVQQVRKIIHEITITVGGTYRGLYGQPTQIGGDSSREARSENAGNGDVQAMLLSSPARPGQRSAFSSRFYSRSPSRDSRSSGDIHSQPMPNSGHAFGRTIGPRDRTRGGLALVGRGSIFGRSNNARQPSPTSVRAAGAFGIGGGGGGGRGEEGSEFDTAAAVRAREQLSPEEEVFWTACQICKVRASSIFIYICTSEAGLFFLWTLNLCPMRRYQLGWKKAVPSRVEGDLVSTDGAKNKICLVSTIASPIFHVPSPARPPGV